MSPISSHGRTPPPKGGGVWVGRSDLQVGLVLDMALCLYYWGGGGNLSQQDFY